MDVKGYLWNKRCQKIWNGIVIDLLLFFPCMFRFLFEMYSLLFKVSFFIYHVVYVSLYFYGPGLNTFF